MKRKEIEGEREKRQEQEPQLRLVHFSTKKIIIKNKKYQRLFFSNFDNCPISLFYVFRIFQLNANCDSNPPVICGNTERGKLDRSQTLFFLVFFFNFYIY